MRFSKTISATELQSLIDVKYGSRDKADEVGKATLYATIELLADDSLAASMVWRVVADDFLLNSPEEIAAYCRELAQTQQKYNRLPEATELCWQQLKEFCSGMAMNVEYSHVDDAGFWFAYRIWNRNGRQTWCVRHRDLDAAREKRT